MSLNTISEGLIRTESHLSDSMCSRILFLSVAYMAKIHTKLCQNARLGEYSQKHSQLCLKWTKRLRKKACNNILNLCCS